MADDEYEALYREVTQVAHRRVAVEHLRDKQHHGVQGVEQTIPPTPVGVLSQTVTTRKILSVELIGSRQVLSKIGAGVLLIALSGVVTVTLAQELRGEPVNAEIGRALLNALVFFMATLGIIFGLGVFLDGVVRANMLVRCGGRFVVIVFSHKSLREEETMSVVEFSETYDRCLWRE